MKRTLSLFITLTLSLSPVFADTPSTDWRGFRGNDTGYGYFGRYCRASIPREGRFLSA